MSPIVIIGTGIAGYTLARELRKLDKDVPVLLISRDDGNSYYKPKLSCAWTDGKTADDLVMATPAQMAQQLRIEVRPHTVVTAIDPPAHEVHVNGEVIVYRQLVLAVGADPVNVPIEGDAADRVLSVNDRGDYVRFREATAGATHVLTIGGGLIGCEFANDLLSAGIDVSVVDPAPAPLGRLLSPLAAERLRAELQAAGVDWHFGTTVKRLDMHGPRLRATLADGSSLETDVVLCAVGLRPRTLLAQTAGLTVNRGIVTDRQLRTSAGDVYALGDCAEVAGLLLPFVAPILQGARALAKTLTGVTAPVMYPAMPVLVKTSRHPVVICPAPAGVDGQWSEESAAGGVRALFHDHEGRLRGFALTGTLVAEKTDLAATLPPWLE